MSVIQRKRGRQTKAERIQTRRELEPYFEKKIPAYKVAELTGYDATTVDNHYDEFYDEISKCDAKDFVKRYGKARTRCSRHLDTLINKSYKMLEHVEAEILKLNDAGKPTPSHLLQSHSKIVQDISRLAEKEAALMMHPDPRDMIAEEMEKKVIDGDA